jgi:hypothetical protein
MSWLRCRGYGGGHRCSELTDDSGPIIRLRKDGVSSGPLTEKPRLEIGCGVGSTYR